MLITSKTKQNNNNNNKTLHRTPRLMFDQNLGTVAQPSGYIILNITVRGKKKMSMLFMALNNEDHRSR